MKIINMNEPSDMLNNFKFPDGQWHVNICSNQMGILNIHEEDEVRVICSITSSDKMIQLLEVANAIDNLFAKKKVLMIPYLMGARYDRLMVKGDSVDLKVFAQLINSMKFEKVFLYDVHSDVATQLIDRSINIPNVNLVSLYDKEDAVLICPDAGASKKVEKYFKWNKRLTDIVYCNKSRDIATGKLTINVLEPEKCINRNCVIIDDLCDGGGTFLGIASQIKPKHLTLIVTHGIFSKGFEELDKYFNRILTSNSYQEYYDSNKVYVYNENFNLFMEGYYTWI